MYTISQVNKYFTKEERISLYIPSEYQLRITMSNLNLEMWKSLMPLMKNFYNMAGSTY